MAVKNSSKKEQTEQVLITRVFNAPRGVVFKAWTECEPLMRCLRCSDHFRHPIRQVGYPLLINQICARERRSSCLKYRV